MRMELGSFIGILSWIGSNQNKDAQILTLVPHSVTLFGYRVFVDVSG